MTENWPSKNEAQNFSKLLLSVADQEGMYKLQTAYTGLAPLGRSEGAKSRKAMKGP